jgi:hypothetical protein
MSSRTNTTWFVFVASATFVLSALFLCLLAQGKAELASSKGTVRGASQNTMFVDCRMNEKPKRVLSSVALSEDAAWRAYVEVRSDPGCLVYLIPPKRDLVGNGMEILGWARHSRMLLVKTELWQDGSDAPGRQQVLAIDAATGVVYEPELGVILQDRKDKQCAFNVTDAGFSSDRNIIILVRAKLFSALEVDETESDVPAARRCATREETWSFNYATGEIKQVRNAEAILLFKKFSPIARQ